MQSDCNSLYNHMFTKWLKESASVINPSELPVAVLQKLSLLIVVVWMEFFFESLIVNWNHKFLLTIGWVDFKGLKRYAILKRCGIKTDLVSVKLKVYFLLWRNWNCDKTFQNGLKMSNHDQPVHRVGQHFKDICARNRCYQYNQNLNNPKLVFTTKRIHNDFKILGQLLSNCVTVGIFHSRLVSRVY